MSSNRFFLYSFLQLGCVYYITFFELIELGGIMKAEAKWVETYSSCQVIRLSKLSYKSGSWHILDKAFFSTTPKKYLMLEKKISFFFLASNSHLSYLAGQAAAAAGYSNSRGQWLMVQTTLWLIRNTSPTGRLFDCFGALQSTFLSQIKIVDRRILRFLKHEKVGPAA